MFPAPEIPELTFANIVLVFVALLAGLSRGFSGFGGALVVVPPLAAIYGPLVAAPAFLICDAVLSLPIARNAIRNCIWSDLKYVVAGAVVGLPIGAQLLTMTDPTLIRWVVSGFILISLGLLASGYRYSGETRPILTTSVGGLSGVLSGLASIGGPPVIVYMLSGPRPVDKIRANIYTYFAVMTVIAITTFAIKGLYTAQVLGLFFVLAPSYGIGLFIGSKMFPLASPQTFRLIAYVLIAVSAVTSMPALDQFLRPTT